MMNNSPEWKKYPMRQYICSSGLKKAKMYSDDWDGNVGKVYIMIPIWGTVIGECLHDDVFYCWRNVGFMNGRALNNAIDDIFEECVSMDPEKRKTLNDFNTFEKLCEEVEKNRNDAKNWELDGDVFDFVMKWLNSGQSFFDFLTKSMSPKNNDFSLRIMGHNYNVPDNREIWFNDAGLAISTSAFEKL